MYSGSDGYLVRKGTRLITNLWKLQTDPSIWSDPLEFKPERFMSIETTGGRENLDIRGQHFELMPFGSGRRSCPGASLAQLVVKTNLAAMIQCFEWKVNGSVDMQEKPSLTLPRAHPLMCVPIPRDLLPSIMHVIDQ